MIGANIESPQRPSANLTRLTNSALDRRSLLSVQLYRWSGEKVPFILFSLAVRRQPWRTINVVKPIN